MPKWSHYLDEDFEDEFQKVERIKHKPKTFNENNDRQDQKTLDKIKNEKSPSR